MTSATAGGGPIRTEEFSIATWNVNSLRVRGEQLHEWLRTHQEKSFSWWNYRPGAFRRNNGLRIDLILVHRQLLPRLAGCRIDVEPRRVERACDHTPVIAFFRPPATSNAVEAAASIKI